MKSAPKRLVIIPTYNESSNVVVLIPRLFKYIPGLSVLIVDDGSPDGTADICDGMRVGFIPEGGRSRSHKKDQQAAHVLRHLEPDDLVKYGLIPEFIGRLPVSAVLEPLDARALEAILTEPRDALVKQFQTLLSMDDVRLAFEPGAVEAIATEAHRRKTGARALRGIVEELMLDVMYELPSDKATKAFTITRELVEERTRAKVLPLPGSEAQQETA